MFSDEFLLPSGILQRSHLGPVLFVLFIINIPLVIRHSKVVPFADDMKIYFSYYSSLQADLLQQDLLAIWSRCESNNLRLNMEKCSVLNFSRLNAK